MHCAAQHRAPVLPGGIVVSAGVVPERPMEQFAAVLQIFFFFFFPAFRVVEKCGNCRVCMTFSHLFVCAWLCWGRVLCCGLREVFC